jgi:hypothetical protein
VRDQAQDEAALGALEFEIRAALRLGPRTQDAEADEFAGLERPTAAAAAAVVHRRQDTGARS